MTERPDATTTKRPAGLLKAQNAVVAIGLLAMASLGACGNGANTTAAASSEPAASSTNAAAVTAASGAAEQAPAPPAKPVPAQLPDVVATIDDEKVEKWELEGAIKGLEARAGAAMPTERRDEIVRSLLDQLVAYHLLAREARERKLGASDADVTAQVNQIKGGFANEQAFQQALTSQGLTLQQLEHQTRMGMDIERVLEAEVGPKVKVEDAEVGDFYQKNLPQFAQGESVHASHILFTTPQGMPPADKEAAKAKAQQALKQAKSGEDFAKLAKEQSQDPGSAPGGGDLGFFPKGQTDPAFEAAAFALKPGDISDVIESQFGYHVIKVHERRPARTAPLDEVSGQIREFLTGQQRENQTQSFIDAAKAKRKVQILI